MKNSEQSSHTSNYWLLTLGALGVVYGDIGTSPLYAVQECVLPGHGVSAFEPSNLFGIVSLMFWALLLVVTFKYVFILMRADNDGEGGIMALLALLPERLKVPYPGKLGMSSILVIIGAALLFGDGIITPAISVLSAIEGLKVATPAFESYVVPITLVILLGLFGIQRKGTAKIGALFGPVMLVWFSTLGILGFLQIWDRPDVLKALSPMYGIQFFMDHGWHAFRLLGSVVLVVTGSEALYADMGHFGRKPIEHTWLIVVFPCLLLNYLGQGALLLKNPNLYENPFYALAPDGFLYPLIGLATLAAIIASQAMISGAFSLTNQAIRLGYFPRMTVKHTSDEAEGQIYVPFINTILAVLCIALVLEFKSASKLAAAYGLAVTGTMLITTIIFFQVSRHKWKWPPLASFSLLALFLSFDIPLLSANLLKFFDGGWIPVFIGAFFFITMVLWKVGRSLLGRHFVANSPPLDKFLEHLDKSVSYRIPGTAVFLASSSNGVPPVVMRMVKRFHALHKTVVLLTVTSENVPHYANTKNEAKRVEVEEIGNGFYRVILRYGYMEIPDVPRMLEIAFKKLDLYHWGRDILYVLGRESFVEQNRGTMPGYQQAIFAFLSRNARTATDYFRLPPEQVIELGTQIDL